MSDTKTVIKLQKESATVSHSFTKEISEQTTYVVVENAGDSFYSKGWFDYKPFSSTDGINWERTSVGIFNGKSFSFNVNQADRFVSWYVPYTKSNFDSLLSQFNLENIGAKLKNTDSGLPYISIGDTNKDCLVLIARQHPGETMSSFFLDGVIKYLSSLNIEEFKQKSFLIIPFINLQGVKNSTHRYDCSGVDYNRSWNKNHSVIEEVLHLIKSVNCSMVLDIHGDEVSKNNYIMHEGKLSDITRSYLDAFVKCDFLVLQAQSFFKRFVKNIIRNKKIIRPQGKSSARQYLTSLNINTLTVEISAHKSDHLESEKLGYDFMRLVMRK